MHDTIMLKTHQHTNEKSRILSNPGFVEAKHNRKEKLYFLLKLSENW